MSVDAGDNRSPLKSRMQREQDELGRRLLVINAFGLVIALTGLVWPLGWRSATVICLVGLFVFTAFLVRRDFPRWSTNLFIFGQAVGWTEVLADAWLVCHTETLIYASGGPFVWMSPLYMPFAWGGLLTSTMLLGVIVHRRASLVTASLLVAGLTGLYIPLYEYIAHASGWWWYQDTPMLLGVVPIFIVLGEVIVGVPLVWIGARLEQVDTAGAALYGCSVGLLIFAAYALAYAVIGSGS
jgi:hypothetical protein